MRGKSNRCKKSLFSVQQTARMMIDGLSGRLKFFFQMLSLYSNNIEDIGGKN